MISALADVLINTLVVGIGIDMSVGVGNIVVVTSVTIVLETVASCTIGVTVDSLIVVYCDDVTITTASAITGVDMLDDADANVLAAVMVDLKLLMPASLADSVPVCREASSSWPIADLECTNRALQTLIPSCQV